MKLKASQGRLILKLMEKESKTDTGLILSNGLNPDLQFGEVVSAGEPLFISGIDPKSLHRFEVGQVVAYTRHSGVEFKEDGVRYLIINISDIIAYE